MKTARLLALFILLCALLAASGCASSRTENGVTIEKRGNDIPYVPFF